MAGPPYSAIRSDERLYRIMLLRDQCGRTFVDIAREFGIGNARAQELYHKIKAKQIRLYTTHIAVALGHDSLAEIWKVINAADDFYRDRTCVGAYLELEYEAILTEYRQGEPGMPQAFLQALPRFRPGLSKKETSRIVKMRDGGMSFKAIAQELQLTQAKTRHTYESFYHRKVVAMIKYLQKDAQNEKERMEIWDQYFHRTQSSKKRYDILAEVIAAGEENSRD